MKKTSPKPRARGLSIGELSGETCVHIETIRYYERTGLLPKPPRTEGGRRVYDRAAVRHLSFVRRARDLGFSMLDIRGLLALGDPVEASCVDVCAVAEPHLEQIRQKIAALQRLETELVRAMARCDGTAGAACGVVEALCPSGAPAPQRS